MRYWEIQESLKHLNELKMNPSALMQFAKSPLAQGMKIGFEIETIFKSVSSNIDFEDDETADVPVENFDQVREFFTSKTEDSFSHYNDWDELDTFMQWVQEMYDDYINVMVDGRIDEKLKKSFEFNLNSTYGKKRAASFDDDRREEEFYQFKNEKEDEVRDELRNELYDETSLGEVCQRKYGKSKATMLTLMQQADRDDVRINWPHFKEVPASHDAAYDYDAATSIAEDMEQLMNIDVKVSESYHGNASGSSRDPSKWFIEPDASIRPEEAYDMGVEIISPPMPIDLGIQKLKEVFQFLKNEESYTNDSTGFHVGVSLPSQSTASVDFIKLALFLGDEYVLEKFNRIGNDYAESSMSLINDTLKAKKNKEDFDFVTYTADIMAKMRNGMMQQASNLITHYTNHNTSINMKKDYIEFRSAGGEDYSSNVGNIIATMLRYARAMAVAADPDAEKQEYAKKLYKLINQPFKKSYFSSDSIEAFVKYQAGDMSKEQLILNLKTIKNRRDATKPNQNLNTTIEEDWRHWVAGIGAASAIAGGGSAAYDTMTTNTQEPSAKVQVQQKPSQKQTPQVSAQNIELAKDLLSSSPAKLLTKAAIAAGIKGAELSQFLAQTAHESANFTTTKEFGDKKYFRKYDIKFNPSKAKELGNLNAGDGEKYKGRGYIQLTGKYNYKKAGDALGLDLVKHPELAEKPEIAAKIAVWFWKNRVQPQVSNFHDTTQATKPINPGLKGLQDRDTKFHSMKQAMSQPMAHGTQTLAKTAVKAPQVKVAAKVAPKPANNVATKSMRSKGKKV